jgi:hypothetical protein
MPRRFLSGTISAVGYKIDEGNSCFPTTLPKTNIDFTRLYAGVTNCSFYILYRNNPER